MTARFRPTVWPGVAVPPPPVRAVTVERDGDWFRLNLIAVDGYVEVPDELYLREFMVADPSDLDSLAEVCAIALPRPLGHAWTDLRWVTEEQYERWLAITASDCGLDSLRRHRGRERAAGGVLVHPAEIAGRIRNVQRCTRHFLNYRNGEPVAGAWGVDTEQEAWDRFVDVSSAALRDFHVRVEVRDDDDEGQWPAGAVFTTTYSVALLQLANDLASEVPILACARENCGRPFARQRGRSEYGGNRMSGVLYCSNACARAQAAVERRRRDAAQRKGTAR